MSMGAPLPSLPPHDWLLSVLIPVSERELQKMAEGQRKVFKVDVNDRGQVRDYGIFCGRCQIAAENMTDVERQRCRGPVPEEESA